MSEVSSRDVHLLVGFCGYLRAGGRSLQTRSLRRGLGWRSNYTDEHNSLNLMLCRSTSHLLSFWQHQHIEVTTGVTTGVTGQICNRGKSQVASRGWGANSLREPRGLAAMAHRSSRLLRAHAGLQGVAPCEWLKHGENMVKTWWKHGENMVKTWWKHGETSEDNKKCERKPWFEWTKSLKKLLNCVTLTQPWMFRFKRVHTVSRCEASQPEAFQ